MLGLKSLRTAKRTIAGLEAMHMVNKGQTFQREKSVQNQKEFIHRLFGLALQASNLKKIGFLCL
jgi:transposase, IS6 family